jgi:3-methyladenine DNA glycosylase/8-oxoguanine DNA glycosylase
MPRSSRRPSPAALRALRRRDPRLSGVMRELPAYPGFPSTRDARTSAYDSLARAICFQQLSGKAASTIHGRVCALTPGPRFPRAHEVAGLRDSALRGAGLSRAKVAAVRDLAARVDDGRLKLRGLSRLGDEDVIARLSEVRGIGPWSAQMFLLFQLGRLDVMPATDLGVLEGLRLLDGAAVRPGPQAALDRAEAWRPLRSVGAWLMWRLVEANR